MLLHLEKLYYFYSYSATFGKKDFKLNFLL